MLNTDPIERFIQFHRRVRAALVGLDRLAVSPAHSFTDARCATRLVDLFCGPLLHHDEDEEISLIPRLRQRIGDAESLIICSRWHRRMEHVLDDAVPLLRGIAHATPPGPPRELVKPAYALRQLLDRHLAMEENEIFPLARAFLHPKEMQEIAREVTTRAIARKLAGTAA